MDNSEYFCIIRYDLSESRMKMGMTLIWHGCTNDSYRRLKQQILQNWNNTNVFSEVDKIECKISNTFCNIITFQTVANLTIHIMVHIKIIIIIWDVIIKMGY